MEAILKQLKQIENYSESEKHIIRYLLMSPETIIDFSVRDLANASYTSPSTVTRLVNKLNGNRGFAHFKAAFFSEINNSAHLLSDKEKDTLNSHETVYTAARKIASLETEAIEKTRQSLDYPALTRAFTRLNTCSQIEFFGFDNNLHIVKGAMYQLLSLGKQIIIHDATNAQYYQALITPQNAAALILSRTGEHRKLIDIASILKERGIPRIILTPSKTSSLGRFSTEWIQVQNEEEFDSMGSLIYDTSVQYILNIISGMFFVKNYENRKEIMEDYLNSYRNIMF